MKVLILEDEAQVADRLARLLKSINHEFEIVDIIADAAGATAFFQNGNHADLVISDIRLSDGLSFDALKYAPDSLPIIFTTAFNEYAIKAFKFNSIDYLLKPIDEAELAAAINKATTHVKYNAANLRQLFSDIINGRSLYREHLLIPFNDGYKKLQVADINHIEMENKIVHLRLNDGTSEVSNISMDDLERQLDPNRFFRANRQFIVNIDAVSQLRKHLLGRLSVRLKDYPKTQILVSKDKTPRIKQWLDR